MTPTDSTPGKSPAFQFYPNDFLSDPNVIAMSLAERGAYITLLCLCWQNPIPSDPARLARLCGVSPNTFSRLWTAIETCFRLDPSDNSRLIHPRLERERVKQDEFRQRQSDNGRAGGRPKKPTPNPEKAVGYSGVTQTEPKSNPEKALHLLSSSSSSDFSRKSGPATTNARSKHPIYKGQKLTVFDWMLEDLRGLLGEHTDGFALDEWFCTLDKRLGAQGLIAPDRDGGAWLKAETVAEAQRRGLPLAFATVAEPPSLPPMNVDNVRRVVEELAAKRAARGQR